jgi:hypothetical protein
MAPGKWRVSSATTVLDQYVGTYLSPKNGKLMVARDNSLLTLEVGKKQFILHPESEMIFFVSDRDLTFKFVKEGAEVSNVVVRERGAMVEEATAQGN